MRFKKVAVAEFRKDLKDTLSYVKESRTPLIITERGMPSSVLLDIDSYEDLLAGKNAEYLRSIRAARKEYARGDTANMDDVFGGIN